MDVTTVLHGERIADEAFPQIEGQPEPAVPFKVGDKVKIIGQAYLIDDMGIPQVIELSAPDTGKRGMIRADYGEDAEAGEGRYAVILEDGSGSWAYRASALELVKRKPIFKRTEIPADASLAQIAAGFIAGIDSDELSEDQVDGRPFWALQTPEDVDRAVAAEYMQIDFLTARIAQLQAQLRHHTSRAQKIIFKNSDLIQYAAPVKEGGTRATWTGIYSGGTYTNQPVRVPEIKVFDKETAKAAGFMREKVTVTFVEDTPVIRAADAAKLKASGIELVPQPPVSYKPAS